MKRVLQIGCLIVFGIQVGMSATLYVSGSGSQTAPYETWAKAATDIDTAIQAAQDGDEIIVDDGKFVLAQALNVEKGIHIKSRNGPAGTEVNGNNVTGCFQVRHPDAVLDGLKITGGRANRGGGVWMTNGLVYNCTIVSNYASLFGGGVDIQESGVVSNCVISYNNTPINAGGSGGGACLSAGARLLKSSLNYNEASSGGGVYMFANTTTENCSILHNRTWDSLGGTGSGGGVECNGTNTLVMNCVIAGNISQESAGGVYLSGHSDQKIKNCLIYNNETDWFGGGIYVNLAPDPYAIENCTILGNRATNEWWGMGGGICAGSGQAISFRNSIVYSNTAAYRGDNYHSVDDGPVSGEYNCTTPALNGTGNITGDPAFEAPDVFNFRLTGASPCKNTGTNQAWMATAKELDGKPRILDDIVDMGAYEYGAETGVLTLRILGPYEGQQFEAPAEINCDMRAEQMGGPGVTQTVVTANGVILDSQTWTNAEYCMIGFTWTNSVPGNYAVTLNAWSVNGQAASMTVNIVVTGEPSGDTIILRILGPYDGETFEAPATVNCDMRAEQWSGPGITQTVVSANGTLLNSTTWSNEQYCMIGFEWTDVAAGDYAVTLSAWDGNGNTTSETVNITVSGGMVPNDYNGDGKSDLVTFGLWGEYWCWFIRPVHGAPFAIEEWGFPDAVPVPGDYNGNGKADMSVYDPATGYWYIKPVHGEPLAIQPWGGFHGATPVTGDYDGDGKSDLAIFDANEGVWYIRPVDGAPFAIEAWGFPGAVPVPGDYNGNGQTDLAVYGTDGTDWYWYIRSVHGAEIATVQQWGFPGAVPVPGDYTGDGKTELAVYGTDGQSWYWYIRDVNNTFVTTQEWGFPNAVPVPGDYTGDGKTDLAVYDPDTGIWYIRPVNGEPFAIEQWGWPGAIPAGSR